MEVLLGVPDFLDVIGQEKVNYFALTLEKFSLWIVVTIRNRG